jgi:hypothetical protein
VSGMVGLTDAELLATSGADAGAFRELYDRYSSSVGRFFVLRTHDRDAALDLTAETFAQAWLSRERFEDRCGGAVAVCNRSQRVAPFGAQALHRVSGESATGAGCNDWASISSGSRRVARRPR